MRSLKETIFGYDDLIQFYKRIFSVFYWQCFLPPSLDLKVSKLSFALNRHVFLYSLINLMFYAWCLHIYYCRTYQNSHRFESLQIFSSLYIFPVWIAFSSIFLTFDSYKAIWFDFMYLDNLILKRLNHRNNYQKYRREVVIKMGVCLLVLLLCGILKSSAENKLFPFQEITYVLKITRLYIELHAIFVIGLHQYMYKLFCKYINFAHHLRRSNLVFFCIEDVDTSLKYYKEIHYKFWTISCELNNIFGITLMTFCCQTSIEVTIAVCHVFSFWEEYYTFEYLKLISPICNFLSAVVSTTILINACHYCAAQKTELIKNIEKLTFWAGDNEKLHFAKQELLSQINNLDISISGKGFFTIDRQFLAGMAAACCTYIIIFIQFYLSGT